MCQERQPQQDWIVPGKSNLHPLYAILDALGVSEQAFAVNVLTGEPVLSFERPLTNIFLRPMRGFGQSMRIPEKPKLRKPAIPKQSAIPGQAPLPERIRINSIPHKALSYYDEPIRQRFAELEGNLHLKLPIQDGPQWRKSAVATRKVMQQNRMKRSTRRRTAQHCLIQFMYGDIVTKLAYLDSDACQTVFFSDIWYLFKPGDEVIEQTAVKHTGSSALPVLATGFSTLENAMEQGGGQSQSGDTCDLNCVYIDYDGKQLGPISRKVRIARFGGEKAATEKEEPGVYGSSGSGRLIMGAFSGHISSPLNPRPLQDIKNQENSLSEEDLVIMSYRVFGFILRTRKWAQLDLNNFAPPETFASDETSDKEDLQEGGGDSEKIEVIVDQNPDKDESPRVAGSKEGVEASYNKKEAPQTFFDQLVLPKGHKEMVVSLIAQHFRDKDSSSKESKETQQVDIVRGKQGVAEMFKKPLFQITCGDLGTTASEVEQALETHFTLANRWGCVLLLDEADIFSAARSKEDFIRNGLVSVFLRVLEYYAGILFLTTNRVGDFDEAFASRIHISLYYPQLDLASTKAIFKLNLDLINERFKSKDRKIEIKEDEILKFAQEYFETRHGEKWNGRQIRNACQTALALAEFRAQGGSYKRVEHVDAVVELQVEDLKTVSKAYLQFIQYLNDVRGNDVDRWAKALKIRAREMDVLLSQSGYEGKEKGRKGEDGGEPRLKTVPAAFTHRWGTQVGMSSAGQSASLPPQSRPQAASHAPSAAPTGPISAPQYVPPFNTAPPGYYGGLHYGQPQGFAAPPFMPTGTAQAPLAEPQPDPLPQSVQSQQHMGGWTPEAVAAWYRQQAAQQQVPPQGPLPGQPPPFNMPNSTGDPSG
ncbi:hypothetical protein DL770_000973 [Monosporascus sp. CRB-9-2]|nr:hypothetical protein DL770_000973 [Monosporascus sp. CRB-9-2]